MSLSGGGQKGPSPIGASPTVVSKEARAAKQNVRRQLIEKQGRAASQITVPGSLSEVNPNLRSPGLKDRLG